MHRSFLQLLALVTLVFSATPAFAQFSRDAAAERKIEEAINVHYLAAEFEKAEGVLTGTVKACEDKCSPQVLAKVWMYVGVVRGSGRNDQAGAKDSFTKAIALDPNVKLDAGRATVETQTTFTQAGGTGMLEHPPAGAAAGAAVGAGAAAGAAAASTPAATHATVQGDGLVCSPAVTEVETRRPIPIECKPDEETASAELRYMAFGADTWKTLKLERKGTSFRAEIPCDVTTNPGTLKFYVQGKDAQGDIVVSWGSKKQPVAIQLAEKVAAEPPSFDDADPPARCAVKEICPPDFPGCESAKVAGGTVDWGGSCGNSAECKTGLLCIDGTCETAPTCAVNSDCPAGTCVNGKCALKPGQAAQDGAYKKWWLGLHVATDLAWIGGGDDVCMEAQANGYACYLQGSRDVPYDPEVFNPTRVGEVSSGASLATTRFLVSLDYAVMPYLTAGLRAGFAVGGGPPAGRIVEYDASYENATSVVEKGTPFLPLHVEGRVAYWFGKNVLARPGLRPYVHGGAGMAQVDAKVKVSVEDPIKGIHDVDAWKKMGQGFITLGGGAVYAFTPKLGAQLNLNCMYMMSASGLVFEPSLGMVLGL